MVSLVASSMPVGVVLAEDVQGTGSETPVEEQVQTESSVSSEDVSTGGETASGVDGGDGIAGGDASDDGSVQDEVIEESGLDDDDAAPSTTDASESEDDSGSAPLSVNNAGDGAQRDGDSTGTTDGVVSQGEEGSDTEGSEGTGYVESGDAEAEIDVVNTVNSNETTVSGGGLDGGTVVEGADGELSLEAPVTVSASNDAELDNDVSVSTETGQNSANNNSVSAVVSGNALSAANIINVVNTNIVNSDGMVMLMNAFDGISGHLNLQSQGVFMDGDESTEVCELGNCNGVGKDVSADNDATIMNDVVVRAATGENEAIGNETGAFVSTGNAMAVANVMNVVNTNIVDSNYLLVTVNSFGSMAGNILLPGIDALFGGSAASTPATTLVSNLNDVNVDNQVGATVDSGNNDAVSASGTSVVESGTAIAKTNVVNTLNQNLMGGTSFTMLIRVHGDWTGDVIGAPEGIAWEETADGLVVYSDASAGAGGAHALSGIGSTLAVANANKADIQNNVEVIALTGSNRVSTDEGTAGVSTGNAYAAANVVNVVNSNIVGQNWFMGIFNIFGDWDGSVVFGRPDLWIGAQIVTHGQNVRQGDVVTYRYTVVNRGDGFAPDVVLTDRINTYHLALATMNEGVTLLGDTIKAEIGDLMPGEMATIEFDIAIKTNLPTGRTFFTHNPFVTTSGDDVNEEDNSDEVTLAVDKPRSEQDNEVINYTPDPVLTVEKIQRGPGTTTASSTVDYEVVIENTGGIAYHAMLVDTIRDERGKIIYKQTWPLESIYPDEKITITYSVFFNADTKPGLYTNTAQVRAVGRHPSFNPFYGFWAHSEKVSTVLEVFAIDDAEESDDVVESEEDDVRDVPTLLVEPEEPAIEGILEDVTVMPVALDGIEREAIRETIIAIPGSVIRESNRQLSMQNGPKKDDDEDEMPATLLSGSSGSSNMGAGAHGLAASAFTGFTSGMSVTWWWLWLIIILGSAPLVAYQTHAIIRMRMKGSN